MRRFTKSKLSCSMFLISMVSACGGSESSNLAPNVSSANLAPILTEDSVFQGVITATDDNNSSLNFTVGSAASHGIFALNSDGSYTYTPTANFVGTDTVTVNVSDGEMTTATTLTFTSTNVNDAPVLLSHNVSIDLQGVTQGNLVVEDADGDDLTFAIVTDVDTLNGALTLDSATGTFTYTAQGELDTEFRISYTDGIIDEPIVAVISIQPSYVTNQNKSDYYYSSEKSHLVKAQAVSAELTGDNAVNELTSQLANGYMLASDQIKANALLDSIAELVSQAKAYRLSADTLQEKGDFAGAQALRVKAEIAYNYYLGQKGIANISSSDASFMYALFNDYIDGGSSSSSEKAIAYGATIATFSAEVNTDVSSRPYGYFVSALASSAQDRFNRYISDRTSSNYDIALQAISDYASLAEGMGYLVKSSGTYYSTAVYNTAKAAGLFNRLGAQELAKEYTAKALSYYQAVNYDSDFTYPVKEYAATTLTKYPTGLTAISGLFAALYPNEPNLPLALVLAEEGAADKDYTKAVELQLAYTAYNAVLNGTDIATAIVPLKEHFIEEEGDYRSYYQALVEYDVNNPRLGTLLAEKGETNKALEVYQTASTLLTSEAYVGSQTMSMYVTGYKGCTRLTQLTIAAGGDSLNQAAECQKIVDQYFKLATGKFTQDTLFAAKYEVMRAHWDIESLAAIDAVAVTLNSELESLESDSATLEEQFGLAERYLKLAGYLATYQRYDDAKAAYTTAMVKLQSLSENDQTDAALLKDILGLVENDIASYDPAKTGAFERKAYLVALRHGAGQFNEYENQLSETLAALANLTAVNNSKVALLSVNEQQGVIEDQLLINLHAGLNDSADALINSVVNEAVEQQELLLLKGGFLAQQNAFPASNIASVDTDSDGMPDFFTLEATAAQIVASGLTMDNDNDNDNVPNAADITPIG